VTGKLTSFISDPVYYASLSDIIPGKTVPVLIDRADPARHYVDLDGWLEWPNKD
jgi:hypothetical protein